MAKATKTTSNESAGGEYKCLAKIRLNGTAYEVGEAITLSDEEAQQLLLAKAVEPKAKKGSPAGDNE